MELTHFNEQGRAHMVNIGEKEITERVAVAAATVEMKKETLEQIKKGNFKKGDVLAVAQVAGIMAAKKTSDIIPMCHPILLTGCDISFKLTETQVHIRVETKCSGKTGVEMEALHAASACALTIYDMCKAIDRGMVVKDIMLLAKNGGKSGLFEREI